MVKAYLAYSSEDLKFVENVAGLLGRARVVFDRMCFQPGHDFRDSIRSGLAQATVFALFVSQNSLSSTWVKFEIDEAELQQIKGKLAAAVAIIIDESISVKDLPQWMQRCLAYRVSRHPQAVRIIRSRLLEATIELGQAPFVGRENLMRDSATLLIPPLDVEPPRLVIVSGLPGIGRRTLISHALKDYLSLDIGPQFRLQETDSWDKLHLFLLDETMASASRIEVAQAIADFRNFNAGERAVEMARLLAIVAKDNVAPVIVDDEGVLLDETARYLPEAVSIFEALQQWNDSYVVIIHRRRPDFVDLDERGIAKAFISVSAIDGDSSARLLTQMFRSVNIEATIEQIQELSIYTGGYPPAIMLACRYGKSYGLPSLMADKSDLVDLQARTLWPLLNRLELAEQEWRILRLLASEGSLPLEVIAAVENVSPADMVRWIRHLVDLNLILPVQQDLEIAPPIRQTIERMRGRLTNNEYQAIATVLRRRFWSSPVNLPPLKVVDMTIHALAHTDARELNKFRDLTLPSLLYRVAKEKYDAPRPLKDLDGAIEFAKRALTLEPAHHGARAILFKALVRKEEWSGAERVLLEIVQRGRRQQFYLKGFLEWKRGRLKEAVEAFRSALDVGDISVSAFRDLADCLFHLGQLEDAEREITKALERYRDNRYLVDLAVQIAIARKDWDKARDLISRLQHIDSPARFHHRSASLYKALRQWPEALADANAACDERYPVFECLTQRADILIEMGSHAEALEAINQLRPFNTVKRDVVTGLRCKLALSQGRWREAEVFWGQLRQKDLPVHRGLRAGILQQKAEDQAIPPSDRALAKAELEKMGVLPALPLVADEDEEA